MTYSAFFSIMMMTVSSQRCEGFGILSKKNVPMKVKSQSRIESNDDLTKLISGSILGLGLSVASVSPSLAVSGGGLDFAGIDISGQDFSNDSKTYKGKDFTQVLAKATNFAGSNLQGCRFYKAYLVNTDFSNADIRGVS